MRTQFRVWIVVASILTLMSCGGGPERYTEHRLDMLWDSNTEYRIDDDQTGFTVTSYTSEFQILPDRTSVLLACKSAIMAIAHDVADKRGKELQPINEQRIRLSLGRRLSNGVSGITACSAQLKVEYRE